MVNLQSRAHLATLALAAFLASFLVARTFTSFYPSVVIISGGLHIHHFWYGIALLAIGGWLGIAFNQKEIDMAAAIVYGIGGGLIVDEVGLLLTFGDYWSSLTWAVMVVLLSFFSLLILFYRYRRSIVEELGEFVSSKASLFVAVFFAVVSAAFIWETSNLLVTAVSAALTAIAALIVVFFVIRRLRKP